MTRNFLIVLMLLGCFLESMSSSMSSPPAIGVGGPEPARAFFSKGKVGSRPPSCEHKCRGCMPCSAVQVPATSDMIGAGWLTGQYTNYEPEGWMCKCGSSFYIP